MTGEGPFYCRCCYRHLGEMHDSQCDKQGVVERD